MAASYRKLCIPKLRLEGRYPVFAHPQKASLILSSIFQTEYESSIADEIRKQKESALPSPQQLDETWDESGYHHPSTEKVNFGIYKDAVPFRDGSSSTVYKAPSPGTPVSDCALKVTDPSTQPAPHDSEKEIRLLKLTHGHPNMIQLIESFHVHQHLVLVFPFLPLPLDILFRPGPKVPSLSPSRKKSILVDLFRGLAHLHSLGIIHRDIKPSNILLPSPHTGAAQIIDFGTAYHVSDPACEPEHLKILDVGTTSYRAPELLFGNQKYSYPLDLWAAGCVAAELLSPASARGRGKGNGKEGEGEGSSLFESGDLGSELALIKSHFETLGTPTNETWPETRDMPDWGKMRFKEYPAKSWEEILPGTTDVERDFVKSFLKFESGWRINAKEALQHPYLAGED